MARTPGSSEQNEKKRRRAIEIVFSEERTQSEAAREVRVHLRTIQHWVHLYRKKGEAGIRSRKATGRPRKLTRRQLQIFSRILLRGARAQGYSSDLWTSRRIVKVINNISGVGYHQNHVPRLLRAMGWSAQRPQREAVEKDQKKIDEWIRVEWKRIKKKPGGKRQPSSS